MNCFLDRACSCCTNCAAYQPLKDGTPCRLLQAVEAITRTVEKFSNPQQTVYPKSATPPEVKV